MTKHISSPRPEHNRPCASRRRALPLHGHHHAAQGPRIGTAFQLESSYTNRNNRNRISYEKTFFSYDHVPTLSYGSTCRSPAGLPFSSPKPPPSSYKSPPKLTPFLSLNRNSIPSCLKAAIGTVPTPHQPRRSSIRPNQIRIRAPRPSLFHTDRNTAPSCSKAAIGTGLAPQSQPSRSRGSGTTPVGFAPHPVHPRPGHRRPGPHAQPRPPEARCFHGPSLSPTRTVLTNWQQIAQN